jgi:hypothetical protein
MTFGPIMACIQQSAGHCRSPATGTQGLYSPLATMYVLLEVNIIVIVFIIVFRHEQGKKNMLSSMHETPIPKNLAERKQPSIKRRADS